MSYILNIDTAINKASICLSKNGEPVNIAISENLKVQAAWLQPAIKNLLYAAGAELQELKAVAVSIGPGSYTGLRIGLSTAKGLCYALNIPLIAIGTLEMMAVAAENSDTDLLCPMIDARRMEVFTAIYNKRMETIVAPCAMVLDEKSFTDILNKHTVLFYGNGSTKYKIVTTHKNAIFDTIETNAVQLIKISEKRLEAEDFSSVAYTEPLYIKNFVSTVK
jgi:tRNA threonylcarbamoyladenosine biosynthesis protein TsaB